VIGLAELNQASVEAAREALQRCCGCTRWAERMAALRPFETPHELFLAADIVWESLEHDDWLEAFEAHPKIGDLEALKKKFAASGAWSSAEQAGVAGAPEAVLGALARRNCDYEDKFGFIFIVCATGKSAHEMLESLEARLLNDRSEEILNSACEQAKITRIRLRKLCEMSPITTHVLDTARGYPAEGVGVVLERREPGGRWIELGRGKTDANGRIAALLPADAALAAGVYRLTFATEPYFANIGVRGFYPEIQISFQIDHPHEHYHVPLLLSPYGFSTYRGS
jgi:2-oxo-4-hydroxy-4-carboxy-5-ureidoimidazoline decarboxylase